MSTPRSHRRPVARNMLACVVALVVTTGCAAAAATPATSVGRAPDGTAGVACLKAVRVAADISSLIGRLDGKLGGTVGSKALSWPRAAASLANDAAALARIAAATTDDAAPEAIQDVADAVAAYADAATAGDTEGATDLRAVALGAVQSLQVVCPVADGGFESGTAGWAVAGAVLGRTSAAHNGAWAALVTAAEGKDHATLTAPTRVTTHNRTRYDIGLWARADRPLSMTLQVTERRGGASVGTAQQTVTLGTGWRQVAVPYRALAPGSSLSVQLLLARLPAGASVSLDDVWVLHH
jgi:carbohydrate binding protein with CBM4/9 domain